MYAHRCENILSSTYKPTTPDETILFQEQNTYMYDIFLTIIQTNMGQFFIRNHETTRDAQDVWAEYANYMRTSTREDIQIEDLMSSLTSLRLDTTYKGKTQEFIVQWLDYVRQYETLNPTPAHFPDIMKKSMFQNYLNGVRVFKDVKNSEKLEIEKVRGGVSYQGYISLGQKVAAKFYNKTQHSPQRGRSMETRRTVQKHEQDEI